MVKIGDPLPNVNLFENDPANKVNLHDLAKGKKLIIFGVPGAFTPGRTNAHLLGFMEKADEFKSKGIAEIICIAVNDPFVMEAWSKSQNAGGKVRLLADTNAELTKALGLTLDIPVLGGTRTKRFSMVVENGIIKDLQVEPDGTGLTCTFAKSLKI